jgi:tRNA1Val (adenine37-N6)-methyltransferase
MSNSYFRFKQFVIQQDKCAMKVGTDGVLLGAWAEVTTAQRIVDIGAGTGLIALMLAQRCNAAITAIEIDEQAALQAAANVAASPFSHQVFVIHTSLQDFMCADHSNYDLIITNPPYFHQSLKTPIANRNLARHSDSLLPDELIETCFCLLSPDGRFCVILPTQTATAFIKKAEIRGLYCTKKTEVFPREGTPSKRILLQFEWNEKPCEENALIIETENRHQYTDVFKKLTAEYYL